MQTLLEWNRKEGWRLWTPCRKSERGQKKAEDEAKERESAKEGEQIRLEESIGVGSIVEKNRIGKKARYYQRSF